MKRLSPTRIRAARCPLIAAVLTAGLAFAGCGGSSPRAPSGTRVAQPASSSATQQPSKPAEPASGASINVSIPHLLREEYIPKRYTCDGANLSLPVLWNGVPSSAAEVAIFLVNLQPVHGRLFFDWAVAGLKPTSQAIMPGALPLGSIIGRNSFGKVGYSICPPKRSGKEHFILRMFALAHPLLARPGFDAETLFHKALASASASGGTSGVYLRP